MTNRRWGPFLRSADPVIVRLGRRIAGIALLAALALGAIALLRHQSTFPSVLGRYSPAYFAFLCVYLIGLALLGWLCLGNEARYRAVFNRNLLLSAACVAIVFPIGELLMRDVEIAINGEGFRDRDHPAPKPPGVVRIAVLGDSFTFGSGVAFEEIFTSRLEAILNERLVSTRVEVYNFGVAGTGPLHHLKLWRRVASEHEIDLVVVALYAGNDVGDALRESRERIPFPVTVALARRALGRLGRGEATPDAWGAAAAAGNPATLASLLEAGRERGLDEATIRARLAAVPAELVEDARAWRANPFNLAEAVLDPASLRENLLLEGESIEEGWTRLEGAIEVLAAAASTDGARLFLVAIPAAAQVDARYWWIGRLGFELDERMLHEAPFQERLARFARSRELPLIDLLPACRDWDGEAALYFERDGHWTPAAHAMAARVIADELLSHPASGLLQLGRPAR